MELKNHDVIILQAELRILGTTALQPCSSCNCSALAKVECPPRRPPSCLECEPGDKRAPDSVNSARGVVKAWMDCFPPGQFEVVRAQLSRMYEIGSTEMRRGVRFLGNPGRTATPRLVN
ncbi:hypothetical protein RRG08_066259 [Elysia crispata]|uniref:Uncharacterized protein n=1 Tax=Elysia crispata TaxID=231223 RepID=A0AAE1BCY5_9GAST|nr:hypothetical protein RRG08_066259 [Elysia crispata]